MNIHSVLSALSSTRFDEMNYDPRRDRRLLSRLTLLANYQRKTFCESLLDNTKGNNIRLQDTLLGTEKHCEIPINIFFSISSIYQLINFEAVINIINNHIEKISKANFVFGI